YIIFTILILFSALYKTDYSSAQCADENRQIPEMCTSIMVGKNATVDGSVICTQSADCGNCEVRLRYVPSASHKPGEKRVLELWNVYDKLGIDENPPVRSGPTLEIPEVEHTYAYVECTFPFMNEKQVAIAEATLSGVRKELAPSKNSDAKLRITGISRVALERASTAREAIRIMASLMEEHGFNAWRSGVGEFFSVADKNEVWCFEFVPVGPDWKKDSGEPGVAWCAMQIPDDGFAVVANESIIGEIDLKDKDNFMASSNYKSLAVKHGWWNPKSGKPFRWDMAYTGEKAHSLRTWRALSMAAPSKDLQPYADGYPNPVKPDKKLSILDIRKIHGDNFEGTQFDKTKGLAAGPFGSPSWPKKRPDEKRAINTMTSDDIVINQCRDWLPDPIGGVMWVGLAGGGDTMVYVPFYAGIIALPEAYTTGVRTRFSWDSAFWVYYLVGNWAHLDYEHMIKEIKEVQNKIETNELNEQQAVDEEAWELYREDPDLAREFLTDYCIDNANTVLDTWRELAYHLIVRYSPGSWNASKAPEWWCEEIEKRK
ncbi:C69 family dipeptidase, partial [bacterium]|nr:C69 family dipeptidase [bacterium]